MTDSNSFESWLHSGNNVTDVLKKQAKWFCRNCMQVLHSYEEVMKHENSEHHVAGFIDIQKVLPFAETLDRCRKANKVLSKELLEKSEQLDKLQKRYRILKDYKHKAYARNRELEERLEKAKKLANELLGDLKHYLRRDPATGRTPITPMHLTVKKLKEVLKGE